MDRILKINPVYGEAYSTAGAFFLHQSPLPEGIMFYRKALELNPRLWEARAQLGVNLMRLGQDAEARQQLEQCYNANYKSYEVVNSLRLLDKYGLRHFQDRQHHRAAARRKKPNLLHPYVESELKRDHRDLREEVPDEAERPGAGGGLSRSRGFRRSHHGHAGAGALGVTFGHVVAMDSPSGRPPGSFHWASTMWHEMSHVFVLASHR